MLREDTKFNIFSHHSHSIDNKLYCTVEAIEVVPKIPVELQST